MKQVLLLIPNFLNKLHIMFWADCTICNTCSSSHVAQLEQIMLDIDQETWKLLRENWICDMNVQVTVVRNGASCGEAKFARFSARCRWNWGGQWFRPKRPVFYQLIQRCVPVHCVIRCLFVSQTSSYIFCLLTPVLVWFLMGNSPASEFRHWGITQKKA
jgi:hypothetical protein